MNASLVPVISTLVAASILGPTLSGKHGDADGAPDEPADGIFRVEEIVDGVWAAVVLPDASAYAFANSLVVEGTDGVLVVDTQQSPTAARALLARIRARTDVPVRWVVNTHWHGDHVNGNQVYADAFPGVRFAAHATTRREVLTSGREWRTREVAELSASIAERRGWLESGRGPGGTPLTREQTDAVRRSVELRSAYLDELATLRETPPDVTFEDALTLHLGGRVVELLHLGAAHTPGDVVVRVPEAGVLAVGDLLEEGPLWLEGADVPGWSAALTRLEKLEGTVVVPSHGGVRRDRALLELQASFLGAVVATARDALEAGRDTDAAAAGAPGSLDAFRGPMAELVGLEGEAFDDHVRGAVREAFADLATAPAGGGDRR